MTKACRSRCGILSKAVYDFPLSILVVSMALLGQAPLARGQTINVANGETATIPGTYASGSFAGGTIASGGTLVDNGDLDNTYNLYNAGTLKNSNLGTLINDGSFQNQVGGTIDNEVGGTLTTNEYFYNGVGGTLINDGTINNDAASGAYVFNNNGSFTNEADGTINNSGTFNLGTFTNDGTFNDGDGGNLTGNINNNGTLNFNDAGTFAGVISGTGTFTLQRGNLTLFDGMTFTGATTIDLDAKLALAAAGSIAASNGVTDDGTFDISSTTGASIISLDGTGAVTLGAQTLTITNASGTFSGGISGAGGLAVAGGTETLSGTNTYTGPTSITGSGTLQFGAGGSLTNHVGSTFTIATNAALGIESGGALTNAGTLNNAGDIGTYPGATITNATGATLTDETGSSFITEGTFGNAGTFTNDGNFGNAGTLTNTGTITNETRGLFGNDGDIINAGSFINDGTVDNAGAITNDGSFNNETGGRLFGNITNDGALIFDATGASAYADIASGTGTLTQKGRGTLTLSGINTYTGDTVIAAGSTLALSGAGSIAASSNVTDDGIFDIAGSTADTSIFSLDGTGNVALGAKTLTLTNAAGNFSGSISGAGGFSVDGGTETLGGTNSYKGSTMIAPGATLNLGNAGSLTIAKASTLTNEGDLGNAGTLSNNGSLYSYGIVTNQTIGALTNEGVVANAGPFINDGSLVNLATFGNAGTLTNAGTITNKGFFGGHGTIANDGIFTNETGGEISGNVTNNGSLIFNSTDFSTYSGTVSGTGTLTQEGAGTLTLSGANTYTGTTMITGGTLTAGAGDGFSAASKTMVAAGGVLDLGGVAQNIATVDLDGGTIQNGTLAIGNNITSTGGTFDRLGGTAALTTSGGTTLLQGTDGFAGGSTVAGGTLEVGNAAHPGTVLQSDVTVDAHGILDGHGTIDGNVLNQGVVSPGGSIGILTVDGNYTQTSGSTLTIEVTPSTVAGSGYDQLRVTGKASLAGTLAVQVDGGAYNVTSSVGSAYDILHAASAVSDRFATTRIDPAFASYFTPEITYNQDNVLLELTPAGPTLADDLAFSSGRIYAASNFAQDSAVLDVLASPLAGTASGAQVQTDHGYWLHGLGSFGSANGYDFSEKGFVIGTGFSVSPNLVIGGAVSNIYTTTAHDGSSVDGNSFGALVYGSYNLDHLTISSTAGVGHLGTNISRLLPALGQIGQAASNGVYEGAALHVQYQLLINAGLFVTPYASASYLHTGLGSAEESGAGILNLRYDAMTTSLGEAGAGIRAGLNVPVTYGVLKPWVQLGGAATLGNPHIQDTETLGLFSAGETALAGQAGAFTPAIGLALAGNGSWRITGVWGGQFGSAASKENFTLQASCAW